MGNIEYPTEEFTVYPPQEGRMTRLSLTRGFNLDRIGMLPTRLRRAE